MRLPERSIQAGLGRPTRLLRPQRVENQRDRAGDQHVVGEIEDRAIEADRIDVEVNEVADVSEAQAGRSNCPSRRP